MAASYVIGLGFLVIPPVADVLRHQVPPAVGWLVAGLAVPAVLLADAVQKAVLRRRVSRRSPRSEPVPALTTGR